MILNINFADRLFMNRGYESMIIFSNTGYGSRIVYLGILGSRIVYLFEYWKRIKECIFRDTGYGSIIVYLGIQDTDQGLYV